METPEEFRQRAGRVELGAGLDFRSRGQVLRDFVLAMVLLIASVGLVIWSLEPSVAGVFIGLIALTAYCAGAFFLRVRPNHDEMGMAGILLEHPLRRSDDFNRSLVNLALLVAPGRYVSHGLVDGVRLLRTGKLPQDGFIEKLDGEER
jgi:hypothetical protein